MVTSWSSHSFILFCQHFLLTHYKSPLNPDWFCFCTLSSSPTMFLIELILGHFISMKIRKIIYITCLICTITHICSTMQSIVLKSVMQEYLKEEILVSHLPDLIVLIFLARFYSFETLYTLTMVDHVRSPLHTAAQSHIGTQILIPHSWHIPGPATIVIHLS